MPTYDYSCTNCGFLWEDVSQGINEQPKKKCPKCAKMTLNRIISGGLPGFVRGEPTTLGQLADRNSKKMGSYGVSEKDAIKNEQVDKGLKEHRQELKSIAKMTGEQKERYIDNG